jgi:hypothetical protein
MMNDECVWQMMRAATKRARVATAMAMAMAIKIAVDK